MEGVAGHPCISDGVTQSDGPSQAETLSDQRLKGFCDGVTGRGYLSRNLKKKEENVCIVWLLG